MTPITVLQWKAYRLTNQEGLSLEDTAKEMGFANWFVEQMLYRMKSDYPDLFVDISSDGRRFDHGVLRFGGWCDGEIKQKF